MGVIVPPQPNRPVEVSIIQAQIDKLANVGQLITSSNSSNATTLRDSLRSINSTIFNSRVDAKESSKGLQTTLNDIKDELANLINSTNDVKKESEDLNKNIIQSAMSGDPRMAEAGEVWKDLAKEFGQRWDAWDNLWEDLKGVLKDDAGSRDTFMRDFERLIHGDSGGGDNNDDGNEGGDKKASLFEKQTVYLASIALNVETLKNSVGELLVQFSAWFNQNCPVTQRDKNDERWYENLQDDLKILFSDPHARTGAYDYDNRRFQGIARQLSIPTISENLGDIINNLDDMEDSLKGKGGGAGSGGGHNDSQDALNRGRSGMDISDQARTKGAQALGVKTAAKTVWYLEALHKLLSWAWSTVINKLFEGITDHIKTIEEEYATFRKSGYGKESSKALTKQMARVQFGYRDSTGAMALDEDMKAVQNLLVQEKFNMKSLTDDQISAMVALQRAGNLTKESASYVRTMSGNQAKEFALALESSQHEMGSFGPSALNMTENMMQLMQKQAEAQGKSLLEVMQSYTDKSRITQTVSPQLADMFQSWAEKGSPIGENNELLGQILAASGGDEDTKRLMTEIFKGNVGSLSNEEYAKGLNAIAKTFKDTNVQQMVIQKEVLGKEQAEALASMVEVDLDKVKKDLGPKTAEDLIKNNSMTDNVSLIAECVYSITKFLHKLGLVDAVSAMHELGVGGTVSEIFSNMGKALAGIGSVFVGKALFSKIFPGAAGKLFPTLGKILPKLGAILPKLLKFLGGAAAVAGAGIAGFELGKTQVPKLLRSLGFEDAAQTIEDYWSKGTFEGFAQFFNEIKNAVSNFINVDYPYYKGKLSEKWEEIKKFFTDKWEGIKKFFTDKWDYVKQKFDDIRNGIAEFLNDPIGYIKNKATNVATDTAKTINVKLGDAAKFFGFDSIAEHLQNNASLLDSIMRNQHSDGGVMESPHVGMVAEKGAEAIFPLTRPERVSSIIRQILDNPNVPESVKRIFGFGIEDEANTVADNIVKYALNQLGKPYTTGRGGFVCNTLVQAAYKAAGMDIRKGRVRDHWWSSDYITTNDPRIGMIGFTNWLNDGNPKGARPQHMGIYAGDGRWIHASGSGNFENNTGMHGRGVVLDSIAGRNGKNKIVWAYPPGLYNIAEVLQSIPNVGSSKPDITSTDVSSTGKSEIKSASSGMTSAIAALATIANSNLLPALQLSVIKENLARLTESLGALATTVDTNTKVTKSVIPMPRSPKYVPSAARFL